MDLQRFLPPINAAHCRTPAEWRTSPYLFPCKCFCDTAVYHLAQLSNTFIQEERLRLGGKPRCLFFAVLQCLPFVRPGWFHSPPPLSQGAPQKWLAQLATIISEGGAKGTALRRAQTKRWWELNTSFLSLLRAPDGRRIKRFPTHAVPSSGYNNYSAISQRGMISYCIISHTFFFFFGRFRSISLRDDYLQRVKDACNRCHHVKLEHSINVSWMAQLYSARSYCNLLQN